MDNILKNSRQYYISNKNKLHGTNLKEVKRNALSVFKLIKSKTKRSPYVRSKYFKKDKVFLSIFWPHIHEKSRRDQIRRLKLYSWALDLIQNTTLAPDTHENFKEKDELLHRFYGSTKDHELFVAQIKENKRTNRKDFISIFPL